MASKESQAFGKVLRELRLKQGYSQEGLSHECGRHRTYVSLIERGKNSPSLDTIVRVAAALETTPSSMMRRVEAQLSGRRRKRR